MAVPAPMAVLGAGSWGTALAIALARSGREVRLWAHDAAHVQAMRAARCNARYLPDAPWPASLQVVERIDSAVAGCDDVLVVVPSHAFRDVLGSLAEVLPKGCDCAWATKGFDPGSGKLLHEVALQLLPVGTCVAAVSGPSFASEVAAGLPTAITVAAPDAEQAQRLRHALHGERLRAYSNDDLVGVGVGGAVKNALAIAAGIADALHFGANARAALISRGLHETSRLCVALGGQRETMMGLAGLGDLVLTCTDDQSRNRRFGLALGAGVSSADAVAEIGQVVEGIAAAREATRLARRLNIEMPICEQVLDVLEGRVTPLGAVSNLFARDARTES
ncbi:MAG: glycerol-3-phosphate dehydrogenase (NAD(P)+) [Gammaproteobacteria bacterium]|jgi:glycerol-3-phosphate dehydrogenase (NAD(P)+)